MALITARLKEPLAILQIVRHTRPLAVWSLVALTVMGAALGYLPAARSAVPTASEPLQPSVVNRLAVSTARCRIEYPRAGQPMTFRSRIDFGDFLLLSDGSVWEPGLGYRYKTALWMRFDSIILIDGDGFYPCRMINLDRAEAIPVRRVKPGLCGGSYYRNAGKLISLRSRQNFGRIVILGDRSIWEVDPIDRYKTTLWLPYDTVIVLQGKGFYPYRCMLVNFSKGEAVDAGRVA